MMVLAIKMMIDDAGYKDGDGYSECLQRAFTPCHRKGPAQTPALQRTWRG